MTARRTTRGRLSVLVAVLALVAGCGRNGSDTDGQPATSSADAVAPVQPTAPTVGDTPSAATPGTIEQEGDEQGVTDRTDGGHRAEPLGISLPDCTKILTSRPGMMLAFPDPTQPVTLEAGAVPASIEVVGCANTSGGAVVYEIYHGDDRSPTLEGTARGDMSGSWAEFRFEETLWIAGTWRVVLRAPDIGEELEVAVHTS